MKRALLIAIAIGALGILVAPFLGFALATPWDAIQVAYFASAAMWNYLTEPFGFTYPGVQAREIEPWNENGETWRRLAVTFRARGPRPASHWATPTGSFHSKGSSIARPS